MSSKSFISCVVDGMQDALTGDSTAMQRELIAKKMPSVAMTALEILQHPMDGRISVVEGDSVTRVKVTEYEFPKKLADIVNARVVYYNADAKDKAEPVYTSRDKWGVDPDDLSVDACVLTPEQVVSALNACDSRKVKFTRAKVESDALSLSDFKEVMTSNAEGMIYSNASGTYEGIVAQIVGLMNPVDSKYVAVTGKYAKSKEELWWTAPVEKEQ